MNVFFRSVCAGAAASVAVLASQVARADGAETPDVAIQPSTAQPAPRAAASPPPAPVNIEDWPEGATPPPGYHWVQKPRLGAIIGGASLLGATWAVTALVGSMAYDLTTPHDSNYEWLLLPVAGPFVELQHSTTATASVVLVIDGAAQFAGLALLVYGISAPIVHLERNEASTALHLAPVPMSFGKDGAGLGVVGTF
jgi:hypothetical protein